MIDPGYRRTDVLVVGAGIAGCLAAIEAARAGAPTAMVLKGGPPRAEGNTAVAGGGFAVALADTDPGDSPDEHFRDTLVGGEFLNNQRLVRRMVEEAPARISVPSSCSVCCLSATIPGIASIERPATAGPVR